MGRAATGSGLSAGLVAGGLGIPEARLSPWRSRRNRCLEARPVGKALVTNIEILFAFDHLAALRKLARVVEHRHQVDAVEHFPPAGAWSAERRHLLAVG